MCSYSLVGTVLSLLTPYVDLIFTLLFPKLSLDCESQSWGDPGKFFSQTLRKQCCRKYTADSSATMLSWDESWK